MPQVLGCSLDLILFAFVSLAATVAVCVWLWKRDRKTTTPWRIIPAVALLTCCTLWLAYSAGNTERARLVEMVSGIAPTYAYELDRAGHAALNLKTAPDDPAYLKLIELEKQWLALNRSVADIYTIMWTPDGKLAFMVDSETDYDHSGKIDDDRERRTMIGEVYDNPEAGKTLGEALVGESVFDKQIVTDRWGTWVSAYEPIRDADGRIYAVLGVDFPAQTWISAILAARRSYLLIGLVTIAIVLVGAGTIGRLQAEVSLRRRAEDSLRASESRLRVIVDNEPECVIVLDRSGVIQEINPSGIHLFSADERSPIGRRLTEYLSPAQCDLFELHRESVLSGTPGVVEVKVTGETGRATEVWLETHSVPLRDDGGTVASMLLVARDFTARRAAEREKESLQQQLITASRQAGMAEIASGVLHNVGNVLNSVNVSARMISESLRASRLPSLGKVVALIQSEKSRLAEFVTTDPRGKCLPDFLEQLHSKLREDHDAIDRETAQLCDGIEHIKEVVRMQQNSATSGPLVLPTEPTSVMEDAIRVNLVSMERHHIHLVRQYEPGLSETGLDKHKILQILINLISNAKKATCAPSVGERRITVRVARSDDGGALLFEVTDNGVGIESQNVSKLFRHGFTTGHGGHGFGLHSSANAAGEMKGTLVGRSDGPGLGATFTLNVPVLLLTKELAA